MVREPFGYDRVAPAYARFRRVNQHVLAELHRGAALTDPARILEVGSGTGSHLAALVAATGCRGFGLEPSVGMLLQAPRRLALAYVRGVAGCLPFARATFDLVFSVNVIHNVGDTRIYFREALRSLRPGGCLCTITDSATMIRRRRPLAHYWPETVTVDLARYPSVETLLRQMALVGFADVTVREIVSSFPITDIEPYRDRSFSCLHLISENSFLVGLRRMQQDLQRGPVASRSEFACLWGRRR